VLWAKKQRAARDLPAENRFKSLLKGIKSHPERKWCFFFLCYCIRTCVLIDLLILWENLDAAVVRSPPNCQLETFMASLYPFVFVSASPPAIWEKMILALSNHTFPWSLLCKSKQEQIFLPSVVK